MSLPPAVFKEDPQECNPEESVLHSTLEILGVPHHVDFIEVHDVDQGEGAVQEPVLDPHNRYEDMQRAYEGRYQAVQLPGHPGKRFVVLVLPYAD